MDKSSKTKSINSSNRLLDRIVHTSNHHCCLWSNCLLKSLCWYNILVEEGPFYTYIKEPYRLVQLSKRNWKSSTFFLLSPFPSSEANKEQRFIVKKGKKKSCLEGLLRSHDICIKRQIQKKCVRRIVSMINLIGI